MVLMKYLAVKFGMVSNSDDCDDEKLSNQPRCGRIM